MANYELPNSTKYSVVESNNVGLGQLGAVYTTASSDAIKPPTNSVFVSIQCLTDTTFTTTSGLVAEDASLWFNTASAAGDLADGSETTSVGSGGQVISNSVSFPQGSVIFGRWTQIDISSGSIIAYIG